MSRVLKAPEARMIARRDARHAQIDAPARARAAHLVEAFAAGRITNRELEQRWPDSRDRALYAIDDFVWHFYDDFEENRIDRHDAQSPDVQEAFARCVAFLRTEMPYEYPHLQPPPVPVTLSPLG